MKTIRVEAPEGLRAEWVDDVLKFVGDKPVEFKFELNDMVKPKRRYRKFSIYRREVVNGEPMYWLTDENGYSYPNCAESLLEPYTEPQDITERIKTSDDALKWCGENGRKDLIKQYVDGLKAFKNLPDIIAYLKLRIITCALNEGWEPTFEEGEERHYGIIYENGNCASNVIGNKAFVCDSAIKLAFKSEELALYADNQFHDIYMDFCRGKE